MFLPPCRGAQRSIQYECWTETIETLINAWGILTVFGITMMSMPYVASRVAKGTWNAALGPLYTFGLYAGALAAHVALGTAANTIGERHGAHIFYGDSGMRATILFLIEALWCALIWLVVLIASLASFWRRMR